MTESQIKELDDNISITVDLHNIVKRLKALKPTRAKSIAITNLETAGLWLKDDWTELKESFKDEQGD